MSQHVAEINIYEDRIKSSHSSLKILREKKKEKAAMLKDICMNDKEYREAMVKREEVSKILKGRKAELYKNDAAQQLIADVDFVNAEIKDKQLELSDYLLSFVEETKTDTIELDGQVRRVVKQAKLKFDEA